MNSVVSFVAERSMGGGPGWRDRTAPGVAAGIGLWVFIGVATTLFSLFIVAYAMRMDSGDWAELAMPWQLWLSSAWLAAGGVALQLAAVRARRGDAAAARTRLLVGGGCALAFVAVQLWAWQALLDARVMPAGNPAASFFYLLTALHGLHVLGGLAGWAVAARAAWSSEPGAGAAWRIALVARYWHFLLVLWAVLFATLAGLTPELVRAICGTG